MATKESGDDASDPLGVAQNRAIMERNLGRIDELTQRLIHTLTHKRTVPAPLQGPSQDLYAKAGAAWMTGMMNDPGRIIEAQVEFWGKTMRHYVEAQQALAKGTLTAPPDDTPTDRRFANPLWTTHPYFNFVKQQYMCNAEAIRTAVALVDGLDAAERKRLDYFSRQIVDLFSPTNFLATNPDALEKAVETEGESLVKGLENMIADLEANSGELVVSLADKDAFVVGQNIATTPGQVVFRNHLFELIQYAPTTDKVHHTPLIVFPPWINKFYVLDLKPQNSLIRWILDQGHTLFVVSWVNPDPGYRDITMTDYVQDGFLRAIAEAKAICRVRRVNAVGYCIAGTTLALTLALMKKRGDRSVGSATFFTTLTDFSDRGEVGVFLDDDFVDGIEAEATKTGVLESFYMARTFSYLRSNDLIYQPAIRSYMMGQAPPAFDLLFWNGDGTNLPAAMAVEYLRGLCQDDLFATTGIEIAGETVHLSDVGVPLFAIACETDHIAAWPSSYAGVQQMGSADKTFVLSGSGHIAGIVNPPSRTKYGHWTHPDLSLPAADWRVAAQAHDGSWWPLWGDWLAGRAGKRIAARTPGDAAHPALALAPGTYVTAVPQI